MTMRVVFRADAGPAIGSGHVMRSLALGRAFSAGGWVVGLAATRDTFESVRALAVSEVERIILSGAPEHEAAELAVHSPINVLVVDHYGRGAVFEQACRAFAKRIVVVDDLANRAHDCDLLVDSNAASAAAYHALVPANCPVLAGPAYAALDPAFRRVRAAALARRDGRPVERVLIGFGQVDLPNATARALRALEHTRYRGAIDVALGRAAPHLATIRKEISARARLHVDTADMAALMTEADLAFGAGGTTSWERCCLGLPALLVEIADNQRGVIAALERTGAALGVGADAQTDPEALAGALRALLADGKRRMRMGAVSASLVDGRGADRILLAAIGSVHAKAGEVTLRLAEADDEGWLLELQRKPETRKFANDSRLPEAEEHARWFRATLADPSRLLTIVESSGKRAGILRLDRGAEADRVNIATDPAYHRRGVGAAALALAARISPGRALDAQVLTGNAPSLALFQSAGYRQVGNDLYRREPL
jgi:UDP-2,4-diacetamido-2,4,6-trideoxy-beta-L-altropyranose hydrolase